MKWRIAPEHVSTRCKEFPVSRGQLPMMSLNWRFLQTQACPTNIFEQIAFDIEDGEGCCESSEICAADAQSKQKQS